MIFTKVLYVGKFNYYYSTENYVSYALEQKGVEVLKSPVRETNLGRIKQLLKTNPDINFVLFSKTSTSLTSTIINYLKSEGMLTVCWCWDLFFNYPRSLTDTFQCDLVITTDGGHKQEWLNRGISHKVVRQGIHKPDALEVSFSPKRYYWPIVFVGNTAKHTQERNQLVDWLKETYKKDFRQVTTKRGLHLNQLLYQSKVVVGDCVDSPNYWSNRVYEITGRGGFLLHPEVQGLEEEFTSEEHIATYERNNFEQLAYKIDYYLKNDGQREKIRETGFNHCLSKFTYEDRITELFATVRGHLKQATNQN